MTYVAEGPLNIRYEGCRREFFRRIGAAVVDAATGVVGIGSLTNLAEARGSDARRNALGSLRIYSPL